MFGELEERLGYKFKDDHIVQVALTHRRACLIMKGLNFWAML